MRRAVSGRDWTKGSIAGNLLSLSWPIMVTEILRQSGPFVDMVWVGRLGAAPIAGVGVSSMIVLVVRVGISGLSTGMRAMVARSIGAGDSARANHVARQGFVAIAVLVSIVSAIGILLAEPMLISFGLKPDVVAQGAAYMRTMFAGIIVFSSLTASEEIMQGTGDTVTPMRIATFYRLFQVILSPFLVFGLLFFPRLGVSGAALSNVIAESLGLAIGLWVLFTGRTRLRLSLNDFRLDWDVIWRIVRIGVPVSFSNSVNAFTQVVLMWILVPFGTLAVAAQSLAARIDTLVRMLSRVLGRSTGVLAGQNLGAGQPGRAEGTGWIGAGLDSAVMVVFTMIVLLRAESVIAIFSPEPDVVQISSTFLRIMALGYFLLGFDLVLKLCLQGMGDTLPPLLINLVGFWLVEVPLAYFLSHFTSLGARGVPWGIVVGLLVTAVSAAIYFKLGRWKHKKV